MRRSESSTQDGQSPQGWSLASFGVQQQQRQPAPAPAMAAGSAAHRKEAARLLHKHSSAKEEIAEVLEAAPPLQAAALRGGAWPSCRCGERLRPALLACALLGLLGWAAVRLTGPQRAAEPSAPWGGAGAAGVPPPKPQQCRLPLDGSPWERHCQRLRRVCVDQGTLILYDDKYQQLDGRRAGPLPELLVDTSKLYEYPWRKTSSRERSSSSSSSRGRGLRYVVQDPVRTRRLPPLPLRPATSQEPAAYLQEPAFSSCTVPLLVYPSWRGNFFHVFKDLGAVYYSLLRRTPWRAHAKLVVVTPDGLPLTQPEAQLLPTLSGLSVQSMADFSRRLLPGYRAGAELDHSRRASFEGGEQRCFKDAFFCGRNMPLVEGLPPGTEDGWDEARPSDWLAEQVPMEPYSFGQAVVAYQQQPGAAAAAAGQAPVAALKDGISLQEAAAASGAAPPRAASSGRLRVLFTKRGGEGRQLLNAAELLERCNAWTHSSGGAAASAHCSEVEVPTLATGIAAAREADVIVGMHGANLANGWMLRPGASVIELIPYQFESGRGALVFSLTNKWDTTSQVAWWVAVVCDPAISTPGPSELSGTPPEDWWPRDRNADVPWAALEAALQRVVEVGGDQRRYRQNYFAQGLHKLYLLPGGGMRWGGGCPNGTSPAGG